MVEKLKEAISPTTLIFLSILSAVLTLLWDIFTVFLPTIAFCTQNVSNLIPTPGVELMGGPFVMFLFMMLLMRIPFLRERLTTTNLVYVYVTALGVSYFANTSHPWGYDVGVVLSRTINPETYNRYIPDFVTPPIDVASKLKAGYGSFGAMPWDILFPGVAWRFLLVALFGGISIGIGNIFRRQWIDVERIPYPQVMLAHTCLVNVENLDRKEWFQRKPFLTGILVGIILALPLSAGTLFPWFPDIYGWRSSTCGPGSWQIASDTPWNLGITKHPPVYALLLLAPLHALFSILFYTAFLEISLFVSYYGLGAYTGITGLGFCGKNWCAPNPYQYPPLNFYAIDLGAGLGLFVITIVLQREHIVKTLRAAFGGKHSEEENLEPMSYRSSWLLLVSSYILLIALFMYTGFSPLISFVLPLTGIITWFVMSQLWGRVGFMVEPGALGVGTFKMFAWPTAVGPPTPHFHGLSSGSNYSWGVGYTPIDHGVGRFLVYGSGLLQDGTPS